MPSSQLSLLCEQIEKQNTDHFGKFYMYVSLLNTVAVRNKTFVDGLPKYSGFFKKEELNIGEIPTEFNQQLNRYAREFINTEPYWSKTLSNIAMTYVRKGKISDLIYIIDQMLGHLAAIQGQQSHNHDIYKSIHFNKNKAALTEFIGQVSTFNQQLLSAVDNTGNTVISALAVTTGLVLVLASVFSFIPAVIGLGLIIGGTYAAYHYASQLEVQATQLTKQMELIAQKMAKLPTDDSLFGDKNYSAFYAAVVKPLPYAAITALEQLMPDDSNKEKLDAQRKTMDDCSRAFSI